MSNSGYVARPWISMKTSVVLRKAILQTDNSHQTPVLASVCPAVLLMGKHSVSVKATYTVSDSFSV